MKKYTKNAMKQVTAIPLALLLLGANANAATIAATNFDAASQSDSSTMSGIVWTGDDLVNVSASTSATYTAIEGDAGATAQGFHDDSGEWGETAFAPQVNIQNYADWEATFTFDLLNSYTGTLTGVSFDYQALTNTGANQTQGRVVPVSVTVNGSTFATTLSTSSTLSSASLTFTDTAALTSGTNTIKISTDYYTNGGGWNLGIDNLQFDGTIAAIPEPSTALLGGLGLLALLRRRR